MEILVVNNISVHLGKLKEMLSEHKISSVPFFRIPKNIENFDVIILSGGSIFRIEGNEYRYKKEMEFIRNCEVPLFGICLGFQLICKAYGAEVERLDKRFKGIKKVKIMKNDKVFRGINELYVFSMHGHSIRKVKNLVPLAKSDTGVEIVKHSEKPTYGVQFHPELKRENNNGYKVLENFIRMCN